MRRDKFREYARAYGMREKRILAPYFFTYETLHEPIKEKKEMDKYLITFSYKKDMEGTYLKRDTRAMFCVEGVRFPYLTQAEALAKAKELAAQYTDKRFYVTQLLTVTESVPPTPPEPTVTYQII